MLHLEDAWKNVIGSKHGLSQICNMCDSIGDFDVPEIKLLQ